ncbi:MAG: hypothetical protein JNL87_09560 [Burkholderiaceae bacterium]|nr:hypothetical protein [Burkholderiaceae bacterium]
MELVLAPLALNAVKFKPEDLRLAAMIGSTSVLMPIRKDIPAANLDEFIAWAKGRAPTCGSVGIGSLDHLMAGFDFDPWTGVQLARSTPEPAVARIDRAMAEVVKNAGVRSGLEGTGSLAARVMTPAELDRLYAGEIARCKALAKSINLQPR